jgi:hypothetical protein
MPGLMNAETLRWHSVHQKPFTGSRNGTAVTLVFHFS